MHIPLGEERKVIGAEGLAPAELLAALDAGARVVAFRYVISLVQVSFSRAEAVPDPGGARSGPGRSAPSSPPGPGRLDRPRGQVAASLLGARAQARDQDLLRLTLPCDAIEAFRLAVAASQPASQETARIVRRIPAARGRAIRARIEASLPE